MTTLLNSLSTNTNSVLSSNSSSINTFNNGSIEHIDYNDREPLNLVSNQLNTCKLTHSKNNVITNGSIVYCNDDNQTQITIGTVSITANTSIAGLYDYNCVGNSIPIPEHTTELNPKKKINNLSISTQVKSNLVIDNINTTVNNVFINSLYPINNSNFIINDGGITKKIKCDYISNTVNPILLNIPKSQNILIDKIVKYKSYTVISQLSQSNIILYSVNDIEYKEFIIPDIDNFDLYPINDILFIYCRTLNKLYKSDLSSVDILDTPLSTITNIRKYNGIYFILTSNKIIMSNDLITFSFIDCGLITPNDIFYISSKYIIFSNNSNATYYSDDLININKINLPDTLFSSNNPSNKFILISNVECSYIYTSINGITWTKLIIPNYYSDYDIQLLGATYFILNKKDNTIIYSTDLIVWSTYTPIIINPNYITVLDNKLIISNGTDLEYTTDGISYTQLLNTPANKLFKNHSFILYNNLQSKYTNNLLSLNNLVTSNDTLNQLLPIYINSKYITYSNNQPYQSNNLIDWTPKFNIRTINQNSFYINDKIYYLSETDNLIIVYSKSLDSYTEIVPPFQLTISCLISGNSTTLLIKTTDKYAYSTDNGLNWIIKTLPTLSTNNTELLILSNNRIGYISNDKLYYTDDNITWANVAMVGTFDLLNVNDVVDANLIIPKSNINTNVIFKTNNLSTISQITTAFNFTKSTDVIRIFGVGVFFGDNSTNSNYIVFSSDNITFSKIILPEIHGGISNIFYYNNRLILTSLTKNCVYISDQNSLIIFKKYETINNFKKISIISNIYRNNTLLPYNTNIIIDSKNNFVYIDDLITSCDVNTSPVNKFNYNFKIINGSVTLPITDIFQTFNIEIKSRLFNDNIYKTDILINNINTINNISGGILTSKMSGIYINNNVIKISINNISNSTYLGLNSEIRI